MMNRAPAGLFCSARMAPLMLLDDLCGDGEAQPGAALFGGEIGQEETLAHLVVQAVAGIGDDDLRHGVPLDHPGFDRQLTQQTALHGLGRIVDQIGQSALHRLGIRQNRRNVRPQALDDADVAGVFRRRERGRF